MNKDLNRFAYSLVSIYSKDGELDINDISEFDLNEFASLIMASDPSLASEATGPDNPAWTNKMFTALTHYLKYSHDREEQRIFAETWAEGITSYFMPMMQEILDFQLTEYNFERKIENKYYQNEVRA